MMSDIEPTFHILIATNGRTSLELLLSSLEKQLNTNDAITVVFDGPKAFQRSGYNDSWIKNHICKINVFVEETNTGFWGHIIRNKYITMLNPPTSFVMNADDDDMYLENSFNILRKKCTSLETLYIARMDYNDNTSLIIPRQNRYILEGDIGNPNGIIPFKLAKKGVWGFTYVGDYKYYKSIESRAKSIIFLPNIIYRVYRR